jgi:hypothetical protein
VDRVRSCGEAGSVWFHDNERGLSGRNGSRGKKGVQCSLSGRSSSRKCGSSGKVCKECRVGRRIKRQEV